MVHFAGIIGNGLRLFIYTPGTGIHVLGFWPIYGAYMRVFGEGLLQCDFQSNARLADDTLSLSDRTKALRPQRSPDQRVFGIALHLVSARSDVWVATATWRCGSMVHMTRRHVGPGCLAFSADSLAIDGHPYGAFFALVQHSICFCFCLDCVQQAAGTAVKFFLLSWPVLSLTRWSGQAITSFCPAFN